MKIPEWLNVVGDVTYRGACPVEDAELATFFNILRRDYPDLAARGWHTENEGSATHSQVTNSKVKGMLAGVSDIVIIGNPTFICEMKRRDPTKSSWQKGQLPFLEACHRSGADVYLALGYKAALEAIDQWQRKQLNSPLSAK